MKPVASATDAADLLRTAGYLPTDDAAMAVYLARALGKPILAEGPAGTGKTELAKAAAKSLDAPLIRLQCYEGLDESRALYEWDYRKQLLHLQGDDQSWNEAKTALFSEEFLLARPLLQAVTADEPVVLLIDEVDRIEMETEALLLEVLSDFQVTVPELGTLEAKHNPLVILTSNDTRDLSEALRRRCLYLHLGYPDVEREATIIETKVPGIGAALAQAVAAAVARLRHLDLEKEPSIAEALDWAKALQALGVRELSDDDVRAGLPLLLKTRGDTEVATAHLASR